MSKPEYVPSSKITMCKAKISRSYDLLEQEINGLDNFINTIKNSTESLKKSYNTEGGIETKKALLKKIDLIDISVNKIKGYFNAMGGKPHIETEKGPQYIETKYYQG